MAGDEETLEWRSETVTEMHQNRIFRIEKRSMRRLAEPDRAPADFFVIDSASWVNIVALTQDDEVVLVEQWRHAVGHPTIEIPGGGIDDGEDPLGGAKRELIEETGYASNDWVALGAIEPNPAIHSNRCFMFLAKNAEKIREPKFDDNEHCRVSLMKFAEYERLIASGGVTHALVVVAMYYERLRREGMLVR
jgi:8-oxo-dGTP pyrophosphatase MutT (NUDIX family)